MCESMCINPSFTCVGNVAISIAFWASYLDTLSLSHRLQLSRNLRDSPGFIASVPDHGRLVPDAGHV